MKHIKLFEEFSFNEGNTAYNKLAYDGLKKIGHNFANDAYDSTLDYTSEWEEAKQSPDLFDDFSAADMKKFGLDEAETGAYPAPKFARKPAAGDKGYNYVAKKFGATPAPKKKKVKGAY